MVRALPSVPVAAGAVEANPDYRSLARLFSAGAGGPLLQQVLLWTAILLAVSVLVFFTLRLARSGPGDGD
jgi:hypothetical protein